MEREDVELLLQPETVRLIDEFVDEQDVVAAATRLRRVGVTARMAAVVLTQARLRRRARAKFGEFAGRMLFTEVGLEQATRLRVAAMHASRFRVAGARRVIDLGCGIGADSLAFAALGLKVLAVDQDEVTAALATVNLAPFADARVECAPAEAVDLRGADGVFLDPARRDGVGNRSWEPADWQPSLEFAFAAARSARVGGVKLAPGLPHELLPEDALAQWVSVDGQLVECGVWFGTGAAGRSALVLRDGTHELTAAGSADSAGSAGSAGSAVSAVSAGSAASEDAPVGRLGRYLYEPDPAVIRGRFIGEVARQLNGRMIARDIAWITADNPVATPFATGFAVREVLPISKVKGRLRELGVGRAEIKKRGVDIDPAAFRQQLALRGDAAATVILTRLGERRVAILADRISPPTPPALPSR